MSKEELRLNIKIRVVNLLGAIYTLGRYITYLEENYTLSPDELDTMSFSLREIGKWVNPSLADRLMDRLREMERASMDNDHTEFRRLYRIFKEDLHDSYRQIFRRLELHAPVMDR